MPSFLDTAREIVAGQVARRAAHPTTGVSWSGLTVPAPEVETVEAVAERLRAQAARNLAFAKSPRGRLYATIRELEQIGYGEQAYLLETQYRSHLADEREPLDVGAVGACLAILNPIAGSVAREGRAALAELLLEAAPARAA